MPQYTEGYSADDRYNQQSAIRTEVQYDPSHDRIDFGAFFALIWRDLWFIGLTVIGFLILGNLYLHSVPQRYTVTMGVIAADIDSQTNQGGAGSALAGLIGVSLPETQGQTRMSLYLKYMTSVGMGDTILADKPMLHKIFKGQWDEKDQRWLMPKASVTTYIHNGFDRLLGYPVVPPHPPTAETISGYLQSLIDTKSAEVAPVTNISLATTDPQFGIQLLRYLHQKADSAMRQRALARSTQYIQYLRQQLDNVTRADQRAALIATLSSQEETRMAASSDVPYSVDVFSRPIASDGPTSPNPSLTYALCTFLGVVISLVLLLLFGAFDVTAGVMALVRTKIAALFYWFTQAWRSRVHRISTWRKA